MRFRAISLRSLIVAAWLIVVFAAVGGASTFGMLVDQERGVGSITASDRFASFPDGVVAYDDQNGNGMWDQNEPTFSPQNLSSAGYPAIRFHSSIGQVEVSSIDITVESFITETSVTFEATSGSFDVQSKSIQIIDSHVEAHSIFIRSGGGETNLSGSTLESANSIELNANGGTIDLRNAKLEASNSITINAYGGTVDLTGATCEADSVDINTKNQIGSC